MMRTDLFDSSNMDSLPRLPSGSVWPADMVGRVLSGDAQATMKGIPDACIALAVTSPPYWDIVNYGGIDQEIGQTSYEDYLDQLLAVWKEAERVLIPNGKLAIVTPVMPIPKRVIGGQHTRHLKNISGDIDATILSSIPNLKRLSLFVWQKQTTVKMFGSYPYPPNIYEDNTIEFISVFVKDGLPPQIDQKSKEPSKLTQAEWLNLTMQVWPMYPEDVARAGGHPAPFPVVLPLRLVKMYTFGQCHDTGFQGDIVLDMFNGTGATCIASKATGRNFIGIDLNPQFCDIARMRLSAEPIDPHAFILEKPRVRRATSSRQLAFPGLQAEETTRVAEESEWYVVRDE